MNVFRKPHSPTATKRPLGPHMHIHIPTLPNGRQDTSRVGRRAGYRRVSVDGADAEQAQSRVVGCDENGKRVLVCRSACEIGLRSVCPFFYGGGWYIVP